VNGKWADWRNAGEKLNVEYGLGELHLSADGTELYYHSGMLGGKGGYDIWVSRKVNGEWQEPELIISQFAGEPSLEEENIYFTHHFYENTVMLEADNYVAKKK